MFKNAMSPSSFFLVIIIKDKKVLIKHVKKTRNETNFSYLIHIYTYENRFIFAYKRLDLSIFFRKDLYKVTNEHKSNF